jgi:hypothetical protein
LSRKTGTEQHEPCPGSEFFAHPKAGSAPEVDARHLRSPDAAVVCRPVLRSSRGGGLPDRDGCHDQALPTLLQGRLAAGVHQCVWDGAADDGHVVDAGVYWSRLVAEGYASSRKMVVVR